MADGSRRRLRLLSGLVVAGFAVASLVFAALEPAAADPALTYDSIPSGRYPIDLDASPDGAYLFVISRGDGGDADLRVYDTTTFAELDVVTFGPEASFNPTAVEVTPDGAQVWVSFYNPGEVRVYSAADLIAGGAPAPQVITGGGGFVDLAEDPAGQYVYAATLFNPQYQFSTADPLAPPRTIDVPNGSRGVAARDDGTSIYFTSYAPTPAGGVQAVDVAGDGSLSLGGFTVTGDLPWGIAYLPDVDRVLSANSGDPTSLAGFAGDGSGTVNIVPVDCGPRLVDGTADGSRAYVACLTGGIIGLSYATVPPVGERVQIGDNVESVEVVASGDGAAQRLYATSGGSNQVLVFTRPVVTATGDLTVEEGQTATFGATADGFWQRSRWQSSTDGGATWADLPGAAAESLTVDGTLAASGTRFRLVASSAFFDDVASEPMLLTVNPAPAPPPEPPCSDGPGCLPSTGADPAVPAMLGTAFVAVGLVFAVIAAGGRRRRPRDIRR
ncbi:hypothetical protein ET445_04555 [Agromyces protaetiae]|uniref:Uncharacterized protein n=1 Tax=Agromyces protaetiae TaxID=2509455 RepID=A0A4V0YGX4_9MICO|nr:hypothetical protein [Agromyces protaetiae]QAY72721.1 hypothetical protein ET445_04555 [Agromyces protaetiae]